MWKKWTKNGMQDCVLTISMRCKTMIAEICIKNSVCSRKKAPGKWGEIDKLAVFCVFLCSSLPKIEASKKSAPIRFFVIWSSSMYKASPTSAEWCRCSILCGSFETFNMQISDPYLYQRCIYIHALINCIYHNIACISMKKIKFFFMENSFQFNMVFLSSYKKMWKIR